jgi:hypothetical protein
MRTLMISLLLLLPAACEWPSTKMVPLDDYAAGTRATVSAQPAYTAGTTQMRTYSRDGSTLFVCADGSTLPGNRVTPGAAPAC